MDDQRWTTSLANLSPPLKVTVQILRAADETRSVILHSDVTGVVGQLADSGWHAEILGADRELRPHELRHAKRMLEEKWQAMRKAERP